MGDKAIVIVRSWKRRLRPSASRNDRTLSELSAEYSIFVHADRALEKGAERQGIRAF